MSVSAVLAEQTDARCYTDCAPACLMTGSYSVRWDGMTDAGLELASGVYFYRLRAGERGGDTEAAAVEVG